jgi:hypothetical protein
MDCLSRISAIMGFLLCLQAIALSANAQMIGRYGDGDCQIASIAGRTAIGSANWLARKPPMAKDIVHEQRRYALATSSGFLLSSCGV